MNYAAEYGNFDAIQLLLERGANPLLRTNVSFPFFFFFIHCIVADGQTKMNTLHISSYYGHPETVEVLIQLQINPFQRLSTVSPLLFFF